MSFAIRVFTQQARPAFLKSCDFEAYGGRGLVILTFDVREAISFETKAEAFTFWMRSPSCRPTRDDGRPNRPLTAYTVEIVPVADYL